MVQPITGLFVYLRTRCQDCRASGWVQHPAWIEYFRQEKEKFPDSPTPDEKYDQWRKAFWARHGYPREEMHMEQVTWQEAPPEEIECPHCQAGYILSEQAVTSRSDGLHLLNPFSERGE